MKKRQIDIEIQKEFLELELHRININNEARPRRLEAIKSLLKYLENDEPCRNPEFVFGVLRQWRDSNFINYDKQTAENFNNIISDIMESIELPLSDESEKQIQLFQTKKYEANRNRRRSFLPNK